MLILESTAAVMKDARHVQLVPDAIQKWAVAVTREQLRPAGHDLITHLPGNIEQLANLVFLIDSLNFCFWSDRPIKSSWRGKDYHRFEAMFVSIMTAARENPKWFEPAYWTEVPAQEIRKMLVSEGELLLLEERVDIVRNVGATLIERFDGQFVNAVESVNHRAWPLAVLLMTNFDSFRDVADYRHQPVYFLKRAQICPIDLSMAWQTHAYPPLAGVEELTAFADYRVPQALRHLGIMKVTPALAQAIEQKHDVPADSEEEIELRAASIQAVEQMRAALADTAKAAPAWQIDWYLWAVSHDPAIQIDHHRTRTIAY